MRLEEAGKRVRARGHLLGWPVERMVEELLRDCPGCSLLEAHRLAHGLTRQQLSWAIDALCEAEGAPPPHLRPSDIWAWERGRHRPSAEHQRQLTRVFRTRPDRLGFGEDHSPGPQPDADGPPAPVQPASAAPSAGDASPPPVVAGTDELVVPVGPGIRTVSLRLSTTDGGDDEPRPAPHLAAPWPAPGALVGLGEGWIEVAVDGRMGQERRPPHGVRLTDRRTFLSLGIALPVAVTANHLDRLRDVLGTSPSRRVDALAVEGLERIGAGCRRAWNHVPAPELLPAVRWQIRFLRELRPASPSLRPRLVTLTGAMEALAGRIAFRDLQDPAAAEDHLRTALVAAREADNPELAAHVLASLSYVAAVRTARLTSAHGNGRLTDAVEMVEEAQRLAATSGAPTTEAYVAAEASEIHACAGDEPASRRSIERAQAALSRMEGDDPLWMGPGRFDGVRLRADEAANLMRFRKPEAVGALRAVLEQYVAERRQTRVYPLANLARALVQQGEIVEGSRSAGEALTLAGELGSGENIRRIRALYAEELREHRDHPDVRALGDRLAEL